GMPDLAGRAVAVVGGRLDQDGDTGRGVAFIDDLFIDLGGDLAGAFLDGPLDVVVGNAVGPRLQNGGAQAWIPLGIAAAADAGGDGDLLEDLAEQLAAPGVGRRLLVLDRGPLAMT